MREHPILFSTPMVQALIEGRKTQTRRIVKPQPYPAQNHPIAIPGANSNDFAWPTKHSCSMIISSKKNGPDDYVNEMSKWQAGDLLWVRETHYRYGQWKKNGTTKTGKQKWRFYPDKQFTEVRYNENPPAKIEKNKHRGIGWYKRNSIHMPKEAARIWLQVESVRVERLQDISEPDAIAEGVRDNTEPIYPKDFNLCPDCGGEGTHGALGPNLGVTEVDCTTCDTFQKRYKFLWQSINGPESWGENPFVWCISFKVLSTTGKPQHEKTT